MDTSPVQSLLELAEQKFGDLNPAEKTLFTLAQEKFQELSDSEYKLIRALANGKPVNYQIGTEEGDKPENALHWGDNRTLRSERLRWLCIEPEVWKLCLPEGIDISGAKLEGALNLSFSDIEIPLRFSCCYFNEALQLRQTKLRRLDLSGTHIVPTALLISPVAPSTPTSIDAGEVNVTGSVYLSNGFQAMGMVSLSGATIGGNLVCEKGTFTNENENALLATSINVMGGVFLRNGFQATGKINLSGATIGSLLDCEGGTFTNENKGALVAESVNVKGAVLLRNGFQATGTVNLLGATIEGDLDCRAATFINENENALYAESVNVKAYVLLGNGFQATGMVSLSGATIGGVLDCEKGTFINKNGTALLASRANVKGAVLLRNGFQAMGMVSLSGATIGGILDCEKGTFTNENRIALLAESINITGAVLLRNGFQAMGTVSVYGATIRGNLDCYGGRFTSKTTDALIATNLNVEGSVFLSNGFQAVGMVSLLNASIGGNLECSDGKFDNRNSSGQGNALFAANVSVRNNVFLSEGFYAVGIVSFHGAIIGGSLICNNGVFINEGDALITTMADVTGSVLLTQGFRAAGRVSLTGASVGKTLRISGVESPEGMVLDLQFAKVQTLEHVENSFPNAGNLELNGLVYESLGKGAPQKCDHQLKWLQLQPSDSFSSQPYEHLAKVLQSMGYRDEAIQVLIVKEREQLRYGKLSRFSKLWKCFLGATLAYGYRPQRAIFIAIGIVVFGSVLFGRGYQRSLITPTEKDCKSANSQAINDCFNYPNYPKFDPIIYSLDVFLPIIDLRLKNSWQPNANNGKLVDNLFHFKTGRWLRYYFWLHIFLGWVLTTLWVAGFSGLVRNTNK